MADDDRNRGVAELFTHPQGGAQRTTVRAGERIFDHQTRQGDVIFIHLGEMRVFQTGHDDSVRLGGIFGSGDWFGAAAVAGVPFSGYAVATVATDVSTMPVGRFLQVLQTRPDVAITVLKQAAVRLMGAYEEAAGLVFDDCNNRLIKALISLSDSPAAIHDGESVTVRITHLQLAQAVGAARETISLALTELRKNNLLETGRNRLIFNPTALRNCRVPRARKEKTEFVAA